MSNPTTVTCSESRVTHPFYSPNVSSVRLLLMLNQRKRHSAVPGTSLFLLHLQMYLYFFVFILGSGSAG